MSPDYPVSQMMIDVIAVIQDNMIYIVPVALLIASVSFIVAWFMDSLDIAGKTFGRHR